MAEPAIHAATAEPATRRRTDRSRRHVTRRSIRCNAVNCNCPQDRASHLVAYRAQQVELDAIGNVLDDRLRQQTDRVVQDPPTYITKSLGRRPRDRAKDRVWVRAVVEVERYRLGHGVTDGRTTIGPEPLDLEPWRAWCQVNDVISDAADVLRPERRPVVARQAPTPTTTIGIEGPSLDIDF